jgi:hypothetical protein
MGLFRGISTCHLTAGIIGPASRDMPDTDTLPDTKVDNVDTRQPDHEWIMLRMLIPHQWNDMTQLVHIGVPAR